MKKIFVTICVALVSLGVSAQEGEQNIGAHVLYTTDGGNTGFGVKYQYNITDPIRIEGVFDYYLKKDDFTMYDLNVNGHYLFPLSNKVTIYPLVGINYTHWKVSDVFEPIHSDWWDDDDWWGDDDDVKDGSLGLNIGGGIQYNVNEKVRIGAELKYQSISGYSTPVLGFGITTTL